MYIVVSYAVYLVVTIAVTMWTARILHSDGFVFLVDAFHGNERLADSVNRLLVAGFYLINAGYVGLALETRRGCRELEAADELISGNIGTSFWFWAACIFSICWCLTPSGAATSPRRY